MSSRACQALTVCGVSGGGGAVWPGCGGCASLPTSTYPVKDVVEAVWAGDVEAEEQDAGVRVEQGPQAVIVNLSCCVPDLEVHGFALHLQINSEPLKHRGGVALRKKSKWRL